MRARRSGELMRAYLLLLEVRSGDESHSCLPGRVNFGVEGPDQALREHNPRKGTLLRYEKQREKKK